MIYVRAGLPLQEVAFLGRWKSNTVLIYAEEALEEIPANQRLLWLPSCCNNEALLLESPKGSKDARRGHGR